ncbi:MAG: AAA family ATPase [Candidatus Methanomethylicaceae archaeon]
MYKFFEVRNFRCFHELTLNNLELINVIAGKNNVGKTAFLEAMYLHCGAYNPALTLNLNAFRGIETFKIEPGRWTESPWDLLFYQFEINKDIELRGEDTVTGHRSLRLKVLREPDELAAMPHFARRRPETNKTSIGFGQFPELPATSETAKILRLEYRQDQQQSSYNLILDPTGIHVEPIPPAPPFPAFFLPARLRIPAIEDAEHFGKLEIVRKQDLVLQALQVVEPRLKRLAMVILAGQPVLHGDIGAARLIPLPVMGEGLVRLASLILKIGNAANGVILVDEIENGLHHSILPSVWRVIGEAALAFNTQVFATTHSLECIVAAHRAFSESGHYNFRLHRLERVNDKIHAVTYDQETLEAAIETGLEVR